MCIVHTFNFSILVTHKINVFGMTDRCESFRDCGTTIPLSSLEVSNLYAILCGFYGPPNEENWMCKLHVFPKPVTYIQL